MAAENRTHCIANWEPFSVHHTRAPLHGRDRILTLPANRTTVHASPRIRAQLPRNPWHRC
jgi:hypothetical protein